jgi:hypothetical protein
MKKVSFSFLSYHKDHSTTELSLTLYFKTILVSDDWDAAPSSYRTVA